MNSKTTISLTTEGRKEYLTKFIAARGKWLEAQEIYVAGREVDHWWNQMRKWGGLVDLTTRLQNEMKGRKK